VFTGWFCGEDLMIELKKYFFITMGLLLILTTPAACGADTGAVEDVGGTIPVIHKLFVTGEGYPDLFSSVTSKDLHNGFKETNTSRVMLTVLANAPWKVSARAEFENVGNYIKPTSDFLIKIKDQAVFDGRASGGVFDEMFVDFSPLSSENKRIWMNENGGNYCQAGIDYKILLSPVKDIPGEYTVTVTYTISAP
jgi:hypothetical protein